MLWCIWPRWHYCKLHQPGEELPLTHGSLRDLSGWAERRRKRRAHWFQPHFLRYFVLLASLAFRRQVSSMWIINVTKVHPLAPQVVFTWPAVKPESSPADSNFWIHSVTTLIFFFSAPFVQYIDGVLQWTPSRLCDSCAAHPFFLLLHSSTCSMSYFVTRTCLAWKFRSFCHHQQGGWIHERDLLPLSRAEPIVYHQAYCWMHFTKSWWRVKQELIKFGAWF